MYSLAVVQHLLVNLLVCTSMTPSGASVATIYLYPLIAHAALANSWKIKHKLTMIKFISFIT